MTELPELGQLKRKEIASLVGLARMNRDSRSFQAKRNIHRKRYRIRTEHFISMMPPDQNQQKLKSMLYSLVKGGKPNK
ncbi:ISCps7, transposase [Simiduia agarivorans SA1 = DSM 21679]|uniref:ISCps7, transposase n=1 Tax=Simiduia agarivorans (strain DSM 21679 / JCM 13881 / BCRC 17597 / SA1) TaxID=1117647 RepID=K4KQ71_SIMAS|nr:ISCps7, transposase [Simiduia agarivorans SA1 = DSM 21679]